MSDIKKTPQENFDAAFEAFLRAEDSRTATLYRKLPRPEPDATLDARVRAQARQALREPTENSTPRTRRWLPAFGAAAALVLVAGLAWRMQMTPLPHSAPVASDAAPVVARSGNAPSAPAADSTSSLEPPQAAAQAPTSALQSQQGLRETVGSLAMKARAKEETDTGSAANGGLAAHRQTPAPTAAKPADKAPAFASTADRIRARAEPPPKPAPAAAPPPPALVAEPAAQAPAEQEMAEYAPDPPPPSSPAPSLNSASENRTKAEQAFTVGAGADAALPTVEPDPANPARYRWKMASPQPRSGTYPPDPPPLAAWVAIVRRMLHDGRHDAARQALADLRAHHPDFRVPADLRDLE